MHLNARYHLNRRTTIELTDLQRAQLLELAARRGERGFSKLVQEAVDAYLRENARLLRLNQKAAQRAAEFRRELEAKGQGIGTADYLISGLC